MTRSTARHEATPDVGESATPQPVASTGPAPSSATTRRRTDVRHEGPRADRRHRSARRPHLDAAGFADGPVRSSTLLGDPRSVVALCLIGLVFVLSASAVQGRAQARHALVLLPPPGALARHRRGRRWRGLPDRPPPRGPASARRSCWPRSARVARCSLPTPLGTRSTARSGGSARALIGFQPSEVAKLGVVLWLAGLLASSGADPRLASSGAAGVRCASGWSRCWSWPSPTSARRR